MEFDMNIFSPKIVTSIEIVGPYQLRFHYSDGTYSTHNVMVWSTERYADSIDEPFKVATSTDTQMNGNTIEVKDLSKIKVGQQVSGEWFLPNTLVASIQNHSIVIDKLTQSDITAGSEITITTLGGDESLNGSIHFTQDGAIQGIGVTGIYFDSENPITIDGNAMASITEVRDYFVANLGV